LQAHLFVFWFALLSTITPPVCGAVFIAAGMVSENWLKVAFSAMALGIGLYVIPFGMIADPELLEFADRPLAALIAAVKLAAGLTAISYGIIGVNNLLLRLLLVSAGLSAIFVLP
jgi:TRAP-type uncharacterized transport system fused permease subunit